MLLNNLHSLTRWAVLIFGAFTIINAVTGLIQKRAYNKADNLSNLFFMISCDVQLLLGLILYFSNGWVTKFQGGMGGVMKDPYTRFFAVEHALTMIIAWVLVHMGRVAVKKANDDKKHKLMFRYFGIALLLIIISIPWPFRQIIGKSLFPHF
jgi:hypothetical protein